MRDYPVLSDYHKLLTAILNADKEDLIRIASAIKANNLQFPMTDYTRLIMAINTRIMELSRRSQANA